MILAVFACTFVALVFLAFAFGDWLGGSYPVGVWGNARTHCGYVLIYKLACSLWNDS
jgi:hypothetical protein